MADSKSNKKSLFARSLDFFRHSSARELVDMRAFGETETFEYACRLMEGHWGCDELFLADEELGLFLLGRGRGSTYGGFQKPINLEWGMQTFRDLLHQNLSGSLDLRELSLQVHDDAPVKLEDCRGLSAPLSTHENKEQLTHPMWTLTGVYLSGYVAQFVHLGVCRAFHWRKGSLSLLTEGHSILSLLKDKMDVGSETYGQEYVECEYFGYGERPKLVQSFSLELEENDFLIMVSPGILGHLTDEELARWIVEEQNDVHVICDKLVLKSQMNSPKQIGSAVVIKVL